MAINSAGFTGSVDQVDWAKMMTAASGNGLLDITGTGFTGTGFSVARNAGARTFTVQPGSLFANGVLVEMDAAATTTASAANSSGLPRIDLVVLRVNWSTTAAALVVIEGTPAGSPAAPTFNKNPGVVVDIPLAEARLNSGGSDYVSGSVFSRRYWIRDGLYIVPIGTRLPDMPPGRLIVQPGDEGGLYVGSVDGNPVMEFRAWRDTGWLTLDVTTPGGFSGSLKGRMVNGVVELQFNWTKIGGSTAVNAEFSSDELPVGWRPGGIDISRTINAGTNHCRVYISASTGAMHFGPLTMASGQILNGGFQYFNQTFIG